MSEKQPSSPNLHDTIQAELARTDVQLSNMEQRELFVQNLLATPETERAELLAQYTENTVPAASDVELPSNIVDELDVLSAKSNSAGRSVGFYAHKKRKLEEWLNAHPEKENAPDISTVDPTVPGSTHSIKRPDGTVDNYVFLGGGVRAQYHSRAGKESLIKRAEQLAIVAHHIAQTSSEESIVATPKAESEHSDGSEDITPIPDDKAVVIGDVSTPFVDSSKMGNLNPVAETESQTNQPQVNTEPEQPIESREKKATRAAGPANSYDTDAGRSDIWAPDQSGGQVLVDEPSSKTPRRVSRLAGSANSSVQELDNSYQIGTANELAPQPTLNTNGELTNDEPTIHYPVSLLESFAAVIAKLENVDDATMAALDDLLDYDTLEKFERFVADDRTINHVKLAHAVEVLHLPISEEDLGYLQAYTELLYQGELAILLNKDVQESLLSDITKDYRVEFGNEMVQHYLAEVSQAKTQVAQEYSSELPTEPIRLPDLTELASLETSEKQKNTEPDVAAQTTTEIEASNSRGVENGAPAPFGQTPEAPVETTDDTVGQDEEITSVLAESELSIDERDDEAVDADASNVEATTATTEASEQNASNIEAQASIDENTQETTVPKEENTKEDIESVAEWDRPKDNSDLVGTAAQTLLEKAPDFKKSTRVSPNLINSLDPKAVEELQTIGIIKPYNALAGYPAETFKFTITPAKLQRFLDMRTMSYQEQSEFVAGEHANRERVTAQGLIEKATLSLRERVEAWREEAAAREEVKNVERVERAVASELAPDSVLSNIEEYLLTSNSPSLTVKQLISNYSFTDGAAQAFIEQLQDEDPVPSISATQARIPSDFTKRAAIVDTLRDQVRTLRPETTLGQRRNRDRGLDDARERLESEHEQLLGRYNTVVFGDSAQNIVPDKDETVALGRVFNKLSPGMRREDFAAAVYESTEGDTASRAYKASQIATLLQTLNIVDANMNVINRPALIAQAYPLVAEALEATKRLEQSNSLFGTRVGAFATSRAFRSDEDKIVTQPDSREISSAPVVSRSRSGTHR